MKTIFLTTALLASTSVGLQMTNKEKNEILEELNKWKQSEAGKAALVHNLLPPSQRQEGLSINEKLDLEVTRFAHTKKVVEKLNKEHKGSAVFSTNNMFALMSDEEYSKWVKGAFGRDQKKRLLRGENIQLELTSEQRQAGGVDWTSNKCMPPIKNQGQCGSCWTFASVGAAEMAHCLVTGKLLDLAEQQLVDCASDAGQGCQGGWPTKALEYITRNGVCTSRDYPYTASDGQCNNSCQKTKLSIGQPVDIQGESALQSALNKQPVSVVVEAGNDVWRNYQSGIVEQCPGAQSDHAVIAVGYGSDGGDFFKIRNSWGTQWGEQGYMRLRRGVGGKGMCNIAEGPSYPTMSGKPNPDGPTDQPSSDPTDEPSNGPTDEPNDDPSDEPTDFPSDEPSDDPIDSWDGSDDWDGSNDWDWNWGN
uniref:Secreted protein n=1 Tax=Thraustotheca clavata TaxID=74557 RepID=A0A0A7CMI9_9STRA|nr:secreted protein [Thraustotheca clavata]